MLQLMHECYLILKFEEMHLTLMHQWRKFEYDHYLIVCVQSVFYQFLQLDDLPWQKGLLWLIFFQILLAMLM